MTAGDGAAGAGPVPAVAGPVDHLAAQGFDELLQLGQRHVGVTLDGETHGAVLLLRPGTEAAVRDVRGELVARLDRAEPAHSGNAGDVSYRVLLGGSDIGRSGDEADDPAAAVTNRSRGLFARESVELDQEVNASRPRPLLLGPHTGRIVAPRRRLERAGLEPNHVAARAGIGVPRGGGLARRLAGGRRQGRAQHADDDDGGDPCEPAGPRPTCHLLLLSSFTCTGEMLHHTPALAVPAVTREIKSFVHPVARSTNRLWIFLLRCAARWWTKARSWFACGVV